MACSRVNLTLQMGCVCACVCVCDLIGLLLIQVTVEFAALEFDVPGGLWIGSGFVKLLVGRYSGIVDDSCLLCILAVYGRIK